MPVHLYLQVKQADSFKPIQRVFESFLLSLGKEKGILEISLVGLKKITELNEEFLGKKRPTDVLSFPQDWKRPPKNRTWILGEIVLALPVARLQAKMAGRSLAQQMVRLITHGLAHLSGLDHEAGAKEEKKFQEREARWLRAIDRKGWMPWDGSLLL